MSGDFQGDEKRSGTDVMIFQYFRRKIQRKNRRFLLKLLLVFAKIVIITLVFEKSAIFLPKIVENR
jgi:hypothetical protein